MVTSGRSDETAGGPWGQVVSGRGRTRTSGGTAAPGRGRRVRWLPLTVAGLAPMVLAVPLAGPAGATAAPTFTTIASSANPVLAGTGFTVSGTECDRVADVHPTGMLSFTDITTGRHLGTVTLTPDPVYVNCSDAQVSDTEPLLPGTFVIRDHYLASGAQPVHPSAADTYQQQVDDPTTTATFTQVSGSPNPSTVGQKVKLSGEECDRVADVHPTGSIAFENTTTGKVLKVAALSPSSVFVNCSDATAFTTLAAPGSDTIVALYVPGGPTQVANSPVASYQQSVTGGSSST